MNSTTAISTTADSTTADSTTVRGYDRLAKIYDPLATLYSGGRIAACQRLIAERLTPGERVLFVGAGSGRDAAAAAARGVHPTLIDLSARMLTRATGRVERAGGRPTVIHGDIRDLSLETRPDPRPFDAIVACFFLNVFRADELPALLAHFSSLVRRGGRIWIADFAPPEGTRITRLAQRLYHDLPMHAFGVLTGNAIHPIHPVRDALERAEIEVREAARLRIFRCGPAWLEVVEGVRR